MYYIYVGYEIEISKKAEKDFSKIHVTARQSIYSALEKLLSDPYKSRHVKKMQGEWKDAYRLDVGSYRVIYAINDQRLVIVVIKVGHWQGIYK